MEVYFAPVLLTLWALIAQVRRNRQLEMTALAACAVAIVLIAGLRWYSAADYGAYAELYDDNPLLRDLNQDSISGLYGEAGYLVLTAVFKTLGLPFFLLAFACALASILLKSVAVYRLARHASLALCLYLCLHFITIEFIQMRWAVATGLLSLGFSYQYLRRYKAAVLCFALSLVFHYYSVLFWVVAVLVTVKGYRRFYLLFLVSLLASFVLKLDYVGRFLVSDSDIYVLTRLTRYATNPDLPPGLFSYAKVVMYPVIYAACVWFRPAYPWRTDGRNLFLFKLSLVSSSMALLVTFVPILNARAMVVADLFAIIWILNALSRTMSAGARAAAFAGLAALYCTWYLTDVSHYVNAGRLLEYQSWLTALP